MMEHMLKLRNSHIESLAESRKRLNCQGDQRLTQKRLANRNEREQTLTKGM